MAGGVSSEEVTGSDSEAWTMSDDVSAKDATKVGCGGEMLGAVRSMEVGSGVDCEGKTVLDNTVGLMEGVSKVDCDDKATPGDSSTVEAVVGMMVSTGVAEASGVLTTGSSTVEIDMEASRGVNSSSGSIDDMLTAETSGMDEVNAGVVNDVCSPSEGLGTRLLTEPSNTGVVTEDCVGSASCEGMEDRGVCEGVNSTVGELNPEVVIDSDSKAVVDGGDGVSSIRESSTEVSTESTSIDSSSPAVCDDDGSRVVLSRELLEGFNDKDVVDTTISDGVVSDKLDVGLLN